VNIIIGQLLPYLLSTIFHGTEEGLILCEESIGVQEWVNHNIRFAVLCEIRIDAVEGEALGFNEMSLLGGGDVEDLQRGLRKGLIEVTELKVTLVDFSLPIVLYVEHHIKRVLGDATNTLKILNVGLFARPKAGGETQVSVLHNLRIYS
jgi:hypothetical protein